MRRDVQRFRRWLYRSALTPRWSLAAAALLIALGVARIVNTYGFFWQTFDEGTHLAGGMEWLDTPNYTLDQKHPPLARIAIALGPYFDGRRSTQFLERGMWREGNELLAQGDRYERTLTLARIGILPFFVLSAFLVWLWTRSFLSEGAAVLAVGIYTSLPLVLAHAGLATTDMACAATILTCLVALARTVDVPSTPRAILLGVCAGLALLTKMTALAFLPACALVVLTHYVVTHRQTAWTPRWLLGSVRLASVAALAGAVTVWAGYRFSTASLETFSPDATSALARLFGAGFAHATATRIRIPAPEYFAGVRNMLADNAAGRTNYFLGQVSTRGRWAFFPIATLAKTPIAALLLAAAGFMAAASASARRARNWQAPLPALLSVTLLVCVLPSNINIGLRHLLPMFPLLAIVAADGARWLIELRPGAASKLMVGSLLVWLAVSSALTHPDYLAYFNEAAGPHPERILIHSDLDWGQDLKRLAGILHSEHVDSVALAYLGSTDVQRLGVPTFELDEKRPVTGWVAISVWKRLVRDYSWLDPYTPVKTAGKSIWIYHIPGGAETGPAQPPH